MKRILDWMMAPAVLALGCAIALRLAFSREWRQAVREEDEALDRGVQIRRNPSRSTLRAQRNDIQGASG